MNHIHNGCTSDTDLKNIALQLKIPVNFVGMTYELKNISHILNGGYIINLGSKISGGTHWVSFFIYNSNFFYFDPFGIIYPYEVDEFARKFGFKNIIYNDNQVQGIRMSHCGSFAIDFIYHMSRNPTRKEFLNYLKIFKKIN